MEITLKNLPLTEWQREELKEALLSIADLIGYAYDAGYSRGYDERGKNEGY